MPLDRYRPQMLSVLRIMTGLLFLAHGTQKLFGFPTQGPASLSTLMLAAALIETVGGLTIVAGFFTRPVAFILAGEMAVAYFMAHLPRGFFPSANNGDAAVLFCFVFLYLCIAGPGTWSVDAMRGKSA